MVTSLINQRRHNCFFILFKYSRVCHHPSGWQILKFSDVLFLESFLKNGIPCLAVYGTSVSYSLPCKGNHGGRGVKRLPEPEAVEDCVLDTTRQLLHHVQNLWKLNPNKIPAGREEVITKPHTYLRSYW